MDTIFRLDTLPNGPGKFIPTDAVAVAEGMASAQAAAIVTLGGTAALWASAGTDAIGDRLVEQISGAGVDCSRVRRVAGARSGFSTIFMDRLGERMIVPKYDADLMAAPAGAPDLSDIDMVSVDVRWPTAALASLNAAHDLRIPGLLDLDTGPPEMLPLLFHNASHVVASEGGAAVFSGEIDLEQAFRFMTRSHPGFVAVTAGERGCWWVNRPDNTIHHTPAFKVDAIDTLAAGDVFHAGVALGLVEGWEMDYTIRFASAAAAIKCTRFGGRLGAPTRDEVEDFLRKN